MVNQSSDVRHVVAWLPAVRWVTCLLLWAVVAVAWLFPHLDLSLRAIAPLGLTAAICRTSVVFLSRRGQRVPLALAGFAWCADAALMTGLVDITGGPFNPFIVMYVTYIWLASVTLSPRWGLLVGAVSIGGFGWLIVDHVHAEMAEHHRLNDFPAHLFTMWLAGAAIAELVAHYVVRARTELAERQQQLDDARDRAVRSERLVSLTTLAAGAAHELSTPLATIALTSRELQRALDARGVDPKLIDDAHLIRDEVDRCQAILDHMSGRAGGSMADEPETVPIAALLDDLRSQLPRDRADRLVVHAPTDLPTIVVPRAGLRQTLLSLIANAFDATASGDSPVIVDVATHVDVVRISVVDNGPGLSAEAVRRAGEPFYTTKEPGRGLGLGLFLARIFAERLGGSLKLESAAGTTAVLELPMRARPAQV
jgi:two-component system sensor histidine kinase RegB